MQISELTSHDLRVYSWLFPDATVESREKHFERITPEQWADAVAKATEAGKIAAALVDKIDREKAAASEEARTAQAFYAERQRTVEHVRALNLAGNAAVEFAKRLQASAVVAAAAHDAAAALGVSRISQRHSVLGSESIPDSREALAEARREIQVLERATGEVLFQLRQLLKEGA